MFGIPFLLKTPLCSRVVSLWMTGSSKTRLEGLLEVTPPLEKVFPIPNFYSSEKFLQAACLEMGVCISQFEFRAGC